MKEASGELSMTAIAVVAIAAIGVLFYNLIWPTIQANIRRSTFCAQAYNCGAPDASGMSECSYVTEDGSTTGKVKCAIDS